MRLDFCQISRPVVLRLALVLMVTAAAVVPSAWAGGTPDPGCVDACNAQWLADKQACLDTLNATLTSIDQQLQACLAGCARNDSKCQDKCNRQANTARAAANNDYKKCVAAATLKDANCVKGCPVSPSTP